MSVGTEVIVGRTRGSRQMLNAPQNNIRMRGGTDVPKIGDDKNIADDRMKIMKKLNSQSVSSFK